MSNDLAPLERAAAYLDSIPGAAERALSRALTAAAKVGRSAGIEAITSRYNVQASDVREKVTVTSARPSKLEATISARSGSLPLHYFPHAPTEPGTGGPGKPPLTATIKSGSPTTIHGAFIAKLGSKPRIVIRTGETTKSGKSGLRVLFTTPIGKMLGVGGVQAAAEGAALVDLDKRLEQEIDRELARAPGAA